MSELYIPEPPWRKCEARRNLMIRSFSSLLFDRDFVADALHGLEIEGEVMDGV